VNGLAGLAPFVLIAVVFYLVLIRPQKPRQSELAATQRGLEIGDEVMLGAGIVGRVAETGDEYLQLEVQPGVHVKVARQAVVRVLHPEPDAELEHETGSGTGLEADSGPDTEPGTEPSRDH
jgi:preprotein translocase subunit YajC